MATFKESYKGEEGQAWKVSPWGGSLSRNINNDGTVNWSYDIGCLVKRIDGECMTDIADFIRKVENGDAL